MTGFASIAVGDGAWIVVVIHDDGDTPGAATGQLVCQAPSKEDANMIRDALVRAEMPS